MTKTLNKFGLAGLLLLVIGGAAYFFLREEQPKLYINEFMASNSSCCAGLDKLDEVEDWIEIYNAGDVALDIGGMYFSQNKNKTLSHQILGTSPDITTIEPGGFLLVWADGESERGVLHFNFRLDQDGEYLGLYNRDGRKIDDITFREQKENVSFGRSPDGGESWKEFVLPTPGTANQ
jgi:hypothetical protein